MQRRVSVVACALQSTAAMIDIDRSQLDAVTGGWWESASTWDPKRGRYVSTDDFKRENRLDRVCQTASCWDSKSGHFIGADEWNERNRKEE